MHRNFSSSRFVRLLSDSASVHVEASRQDPAERLSQWLNAFDAITLQAAQQPVRTQAAPKPPRAAAARARALEQEFLSLRTALAKAMTVNDLPGAGARPAPRPALPPQTPPEAETEYGPYRQRYLDRQRQMELRIGPFRDHVRQTMAAASPGLRQLALLDAALEETLGGREQKLLSTVPALLEKRFERLKQPHPQGPGDAQVSQAPSRHAGGWQQAFGKELQAILLAEMNLRLEPVAGLIEAFSNEVKKYQ